MAPSSSKSHSQLVMLPVDWSVNCTQAGPSDSVGSAKKSAWQEEAVFVGVGVGVGVGVATGSVQAAKASSPTTNKIEIA